jgi:putative tryptophan/tyrosine transport system substrate-binding protein
VGKSILKRRELLAVLGSSVVWPLVAQGQQPAKIARIGFLGATHVGSWTTRVEAFRSGLRELGYVDGKNVFIEYRWANEKYDELPALAAELVNLKVDVLTYGTPGTLAAKRATTTIPIVMLYIGDAVATGVVTSLGRPSGNITGSTYFLPELMAKRLQLLKEAMPQVAEVAILVKPDNPLFKATLQALQIAANSLKIGLHQFDVRGPRELEATFSAMAKKRIGAAVVQEDAVFVSNARAIADLGAKYSLPLAGFDELADAGALFAYGVSFLTMCRRGAAFVDKILRGVKPADIPVEQATKFETAVNVRTAKSLGVTIPPSILLRADRVIE